jgi:ribulose-5-phosphate 4-epimerase/fuculose-1-phosphate aldolase
MRGEDDLRLAMARLAKSLFDRGFTVGSSGNISAACEGGLLMTPTNACLGFLDPARISKVDHAGNHIGGDKPSKEIFLHKAFYDTRPATGAVVHLHSTYATALSCLPETNPEDCIPPITPYVVMRVGKVKLLPYVRPGDPAMGEMIRQLGGTHASVLLANHGPVVSADNLEAAVYAAEELEETARLVLLLRGMNARRLSEANIAELAAVFGARKP